MIKKLVLLASMLLLVSTNIDAKRFTVISASSGGDLGDAIQRSALSKIDFVAEYSPGGNGLLAPNKFVTKPQGNYLLMSGLMTQQVIGPKLYPEVVKYSDKDFKPISKLASTFFIIIAHKTAKFPNGTIAVSGSNAQFTVKLLEKAIGKSIETIPYKSITQGIIDVMSDDVQFALVQAGTAVPFIASNKVTAVVTTAPRRVSGIEQIPSISESYPNFSVVAAFGLYGQPSITRENVNDILKSITSALTSDEVRDTYQRNYLLMPTVIGPNYLDEFVNKQRRSQ